MPVHAMTSDYHGDIKDAREKFHGNILVYVGWDHHLLFCASKAYPVPPSAPFSVVVEQLMTAAFSQHPEFSDINWDSANWILDGEVFAPDMDAPIEDQGVGHKSLIRLSTPELKGYASAGI